MTDQLVAIKLTHTAELLAGSLIEDRDWLITEVERLRDLESEISSLDRHLERARSERDKARAEVKKLKAASGKGSLKDAKLTVEQHLAWKREDR